MTKAEIQPLEMTLEVGAARPILGRAAMVTNLEGWTGGGVAMRGKSTERSQAHGNFSERSYRGARLLSVEGHAWADSRKDAAEMVDDLNAFLAEGTFGTFRVVDPDVGTRWVRGKLTGTPEIDWDGLEDIDFAFDIECADPRKYGDAFTVTTSAPKDIGGLRFDLFGGAPLLDGKPTGAVGVLDFGESPQDGTISYVHNGTADVWPVLRVAGPTPGFSITEAETGRRLVYGAVAAHSVLWLDSRSGTARLENEQDRTTSLLRDEWFHIPGRSTRTYVFESPEGPEATMTLEVYPAWW